MIIKEISKFVVRKMNTVYQRSEEECIKMEYMLEVILDKITILSCVLFLCYLFGYMEYSVVCLSAFMLLRTFAGGFHMKTSVGCCIMSALFVILGGYLTKVLEFTSFVWFIVMIPVAVIVFMYAPQETSNAPFAPQFYKIKKWESITVVAIYTVIILITKGYLGRGLAIGTALEAITIVPVFNRK